MLRANYACIYRWCSLQTALQYMHNQIISIAYIYKVMHTCRNSNTLFKVRKGAKIRNRYNQVPNLTQDTKSFLSHKNKQINKQKHKINC